MNFFNTKREVPAATLIPVKTRRRLFRKYVALFVGVVCLALLSNDLIELRFLIRDYTNFSIRLQREQALAAANKIDQFIKDIEKQIGWTTQFPWTTVTVEQWRIDVARLFSQAPAITELTKLDASGRERLHVSRLAPDRIGSGIDFSKEPSFTVAVASMVHYGPVRFRRGSEPYMTISLNGPDNEVTIAEVNLKFIWDVVSQIRVGQGGKAYVVDDSDRLIAHPNLGLVLRNTDASQLPQVRDTRASGPTMSAGEGQAVEDFSGQKVLAASAPVAALNWLVLVELPVDEAFAQLDQAIWRSSLIFVGALIIAVLAGLLLARNMVVPIHTLRTGAARIGAGNFEQRIAIKTGDELEALADQFNRMAVQLQESHANLELKVEHRTAELTALNQRLATAVERLRQANIFKNEILGTVAHDLKNPMAVILGRAELLAEIIDKMLSPHEKLVAQVISIRDTGRQMVEMINSLLADAMSDAHEISIRRTAVNISMLINEVTQANRPLAEKKRQTFTVNVPPNLIVIGDHDRLREAVDNLVNNAIKYTPPAGRIDLVIMRDGDCALIRVADSGLGLTTNDKTRLFGRFERLSAKPTGGESSTGLGLSIVKRIIELHGGKIVADSLGRGQGATFTISLPLPPDAADISSSFSGQLPVADTNTIDADAFETVSAFATSILLIEDDGFVRHALDDLLSYEGMTVVSVATAKEALALVNDKGIRPDLVICDYNLSGDINGVECIDALRLSLARKVPAIVLTGEARPWVIKSIATHGIGIAIKPADGDELLRLIKLHARTNATP